VVVKKKVELFWGYTIWSVWWFLVSICRWLDVVALCIKRALGRVKMEAVRGCWVNDLMVGQVIV